MTDFADTELVDTVPDTYARFISIWHEEEGTP